MLYNLILLTLLGTLVHTGKYAQTIEGPIVDFESTWEVLSSLDIQEA